MADQWGIVDLPLMMRPARERVCVLPRSVANTPVQGVRVLKGDGFQVAWSSGWSKEAWKGTNLKAHRSLVRGLYARTPTHLGYQQQAPDAITPQLVCA